MNVKAALNVPGLLLLRINMPILVVNLVVMTPVFCLKFYIFKAYPSNLNINSAINIVFKFACNMSKSKLFLSE